LFRLLLIVRTTRIALSLLHCLVFKVRGIHACRSLSGDSLINLSYRLAACQAAISWFLTDPPAISRSEFVSYHRSSPQSTNQFLAVPTTAATVRNTIRPPPDRQHTRVLLQPQHPICVCIRSRGDLFI